MRLFFACQLEHFLSQLLDQITYFQRHVVDEILRGEMELHAALTCRDVDIIVQQTGLVYIRRKEFLHSYRATAAADVAGER